MSAANLPPDEQRQEQVAAKASSTGFFFPYLDSIRGVAILMVVVFHTFSFTPQSGHPWQSVAVKFLQSLSLGVPLFFVLSGFLISLIVIHDPKTFSAGSYAVRRLARIAPPFLLSLALFLCIRIRHQSVSWNEAGLVLGNMATLPNFVPQVKLINPVSWSLFIEMHFYLLLPLVYFAWRRLLPGRAEAATLATLVIPAVVCRAIGWLTPASDVSERLFLLHRFPAALDYFAWGWIFAWLFCRHRERLARSAMTERIALAGACLLPLFTIFFTASLVVSGEDYHISSPLVHELNRFVICAAGFMMLFSAAVTRRGVTGAIFGNKTLIYIGVISYEWFLFHAAIIPWVRYQAGVILHLSPEWPPAGGLITLPKAAEFAVVSLIGIAASFAFAAAVHQWFSKPLMRRFRK